MTDVRAFHDYQSRMSVFAERERALEARKIAIQELYHKVALQQKENQVRQEQLEQERIRFAQKKTAQDEKVEAKEAHARSQQERIKYLMEEEEKISANIQKCDEAILSAAAELERRRHLEGNLREARDKLSQLKYSLEEKDSQIMKMESRIARLEMSTEKRHGQFAERLPDEWLPRVVDANAASSLDATAGESILLVDEEVAI